MTNVTPPYHQILFYSIKKSRNQLGDFFGLGAISIILSIIVLAFLSVAIYSIIVLLSLALLIDGIERILFILRDVHKLIGHRI